jgi:hypothetical protein
MTSTPATVPDRPPLPPLSAVPPSSTAAMQVSAISPLLPVVGVAARKRAASITPPSAPQNPLMPYTSTVTAGIGMPASRDASALPPMLYTARPSVVRRSMSTRMTSSTTKITAGVGMPNTRLLPTWFRKSEFSVVVEPPVMTSTNP